MRKVFETLILIIVFLVFLSVETRGDVFCVSNETEFQAALTQAGLNGQDDVIKVRMGRYSGTFTYSTDEGHSITLLGGYLDCYRSVVNPINTVLDGTCTSGRVLNLANSNGGDIFIEGLTIENGSGLSARSSGNIGRAGDITITHCIITRNIGNTDGGGVHADTYSSSGGSGGNIIFTHNAIIENTTNTGGGAYLRSYSHNGAAGHIIVANNTIARNRAITQWAGGLWVISPSSSGTAGRITIINNIITDNTCGSTGGGLLAAANSLSGTQGIVTFTNNTITGNMAASSGGGVYLMGEDTGTTNVYNNIIWNNDAPTGADIYLDVNGIFRGYNNCYHGISGSWTYAGGNFNADPQFIGGGDYHLLNSSPCIDAGRNDAPERPTSDFEGDPRIVDGDDNGTATVDVGADEYVLGLACRFKRDGSWTGAGHGLDGWRVGDFNGDGRDDIFRVVAGVSGAEVYTSNGSRFVYSGSWTGSGYGSDGWYIGDFNGDGMDDILRVVPGTSGADVFLSNGTRFVHSGSWTMAGPGTDGWHVGDFNGDGRDDIFRVLPGTSGADVFTSNGSQFLHWGSWTVSGYGSDGWYIGDFNGDGMDDIFRYLPDVSGADVFLSNGTTFVRDGSWTMHWHGDFGWYVGDFNGDGKDDIFRTWTGVSGADVFLSEGTRFSHSGSWTGSGHGADGWYVGDYDNDGKADIFRYLPGTSGADVFLAYCAATAGAAHISDESLLALDEYMMEDLYRMREIEMSYEDEAEFLAPFKERALMGEEVSIYEIKRAYEEKVGRVVRLVTIRQLLYRHSFWDCLEYYQRKDEEREVKNK
jgi:hypothetical protein